MAREITEDMFLCPCGKCGQTVKPVPELLTSIKNLQTGLLFKLQITSGVRCEAHNKAVGGSPGSKHLTGEACDIKINDSQSAYSILRLAICSRFLTFFELCPAHLHVDVRQGPSRIITGVSSNGFK